MAKYRKADNCGPVPYPDQSGRYLGEGEVVEDDENNNWAPLVALGFIVETEAAATPDKQESAEELAKAEAPPAEEPAAEEKPKKKSSRRKSKKAEKKEELSDGMQQLDDGDGAEEMDPSASWESDS